MCSKRCTQRFGNSYFSGLNDQACKSEKRSYRGLAARSSALSLGLLSLLSLCLLGCRSRSCKRKVQVCPICHMGAKTDISNTALAMNTRQRQQTARSQLLLYPSPCESENLLALLQELQLYGACSCLPVLCLCACVCAPFCRTYLSPQSLDHERDYSSVHARVSLLSRKCPVPTVQAQVS